MKPFWKRFALVAVAVTLTGVSVGLAAPPIPGAPKYVYNCFYLDGVYTCWRIYIYPHP
jgi:hypothetical protein